MLSFSGGVDSTFLATLLLIFREEYGFTLTFVHFNHNAHSHAINCEKFCNTFAKKNKVKYYCKNLIIRKAPPKKNANIKKSLFCVRKYKIMAIVEKSHK